MELTLKLMLAGRYEILRAPMPLTQAKELSDQLKAALDKANETQATARPPMTTPSETPDESERRAQDCRAKAASCKWVAEREPDKKLRKFYAKLSIEKEAASETKAAAGPPMTLGNMRELGVTYPPLRRSSARIFA